MSERASPLTSASGGLRPPLARSTVRRDESLRLDPERLAAGWGDDLVVRVDEQGRTPVGFTDGSDGGTATLITRPATEFGAALPRDAVLLGEHGERAYWALRVRSIEAGVAGDSSGVWMDLRACGAQLDATGAGLFSTAMAVLNWHDAARFCARCGAATEPEHAGWMRRCVVEGHEEYLRTDPAVICLVHDGTDRTLLARQPVWPPGRYSVLAGFVEAGESLEACVAREVAEEVGVTVREIRYLGSQPWPFPRSLMIGFSALADPEQPLLLADGEIEDAFWASRAQVRAAADRGDWAARTDDGALLLPPPVSIARAMLDAWLADER